MLHARCRFARQRAEFGPGRLFAGDPAARYAQQAVRLCIAEMPIPDARPVEHLGVHCLGVTVEQTVDVQGLEQRRQLRAIIIVRKDEPQPALGRSGQVFFQPAKLLGRKAARLLYVVRVIVGKAVHQGQVHPAPVQAVVVRAPVPAAAHRLVPVFARVVKGHVESRKVVPPAP